MIVIDCNNFELIPKAYGGATGPKICVVYNGITYMLKCQQVLRGRDMRNVEIFYANDCVSEYIGSHIYSILGIPVHDTLLGTYNGKLCVLCKDIAYPNDITEFRELRNTLMKDESVQHSSGMSTNLEDIFHVIDSAMFIDKEEVRNRFWLMFAVDSVIGNCDRNNGNWGFIRDSKSYSLTSVYDCGGCLNNKKSDSQLDLYINEKGIENMAVNYVFNYRLNGKQVNPFHYMRDHMNTYLQRAVDLTSTLDMGRVKDMIYDIRPIISEIRAEYYVKVISRRLEEIRKFCLQ